MRFKLGGSSFFFSSDDRALDVSKVASG